MPTFYRGGGGGMEKVVVLCNDVYGVGIFNNFVNDWEMVVFKNRTMSLKFPFSFSLSLPFSLSVRTISRDVGEVQTTG